MMFLWQACVFITYTIVEANHECGYQNARCYQKNIYARSVDGSCNNIDHPNWGTQFSVYDRLVPAKYGRKFALAHSKNGKPLPSARLISTTLFLDETSPDPDLTISAVQYGQLVAHDLSEAFIVGDPLSCCTSTFQEKDHMPSNCIPIKIPHDDPNYSIINATCLSMMRSQTNQERGCSLYLQNISQISGVTAFLDLSNVYGNTEEESRSYRTQKNGLLQLNVRNHREWLPEANDKELMCPFLPKGERCYQTGDDRANQHLNLVILHTLWPREHNRLARELSRINPHWNDEKLFNIARSIAIAEHQYLTYYELLPIWTSRNQLLQLGIISDSDNFINDYDGNMRPHIYNEFAHGAFRHFHSMIPGTLQLADSSGCPYRTLVQRDYMFRPNCLERSDIFDSLLRGMTTQPSLTPDAFTDPELTNFFFAMTYKFGFDMKALDVQRARDHGLGSYNDLREFCGLGRVQNFNQLLDVMDLTSVEKLGHLYDYVDDIELIVAGSLEKQVPGTLLGPTFLCIFYEQFYRTRKSDRFFFENTHSGFTRLQLEEIKKFSFSRFICDNGNNVTHMQKNGFLQVSSSNLRLPCHQIPRVNLNLWKENRQEIIAKKI
ncbi:peroxidase-like [Diorhabda carinulata]|uniref:peroxidase-like n=1 Tax=Diorhabda carinulata TaxID=1163345 RepID=UPI0025A1ECDF|nr:peroxidase-like [Diorhabda carinulata]